MGNRAASSKCGTADCLEALGVKIDAAPARVPRFLKKSTFVFYLHKSIIQAMRLLAWDKKRNGNKNII